MKGKLSFIGFRETRSHHAGSIEHVLVVDESDAATYSPRLPEWSGSKKINMI